MNDLIISPHKLIHKIQLIIIIFFGVIFFKNFSKMIDLAVETMTVTEVLISCLILLVYHFTFVLVHEFSHFLASRLLQQKSEVFIRKKYIAFYDDLSKKDFIIIAITPLLVHIIQLLLYVLLFPTNLLGSTIFGLIILLSVMSDCYFVFKVAGNNGDNVLFRFKERGIFEVVKLNN